MYMLTPFSLPLIAAVLINLGLLATTTYAKAMAWTLRQTQKETSQTSIPPSPLLSGFSLDFSSSVRVQCVCSLLLSAFSRASCHLIYLKHSHHEKLYLACHHYRDISFEGQSLKALGRSTGRSHATTSCS